MTWNRKLWAVEFRGADGRAVLIGIGWHVMDRDYYPGEPARVLLFQDRRTARAYCAMKQVECNTGRNAGRAKWRFLPVRVIETVKRVK